MDKKPDIDLEKYSKNMPRHLVWVCICLAWLAMDLFPGSLDSWAQATTPPASQVKREVVRWLKARLENPRAYQGLNWSQVVKHPWRGPYIYSIRHYYRLRTPDGGYMYLDRIFLFDADGKVAGVEDVILGQDPIYHPLRP
ncbi:MAG: hypothetical protein PVG03_00175 [Desulfarculaceae bacterium]